MRPRQTVRTLDQVTYERDFGFVEWTKLPIALGKVGTDIDRGADQHFENTGSGVVGATPPASGERGEREQPMSTAILPDGSVVVRLPAQTVHVDVRTKAIHLRAVSARDELGGSILDSFPQAAVDRVRLIRATDSHYLLFLDLRSGRSLSLGEATSHDTAMMTARVVANVTRCKIEVSQGTHALPGPSDRFSAAITYDARLDKDGEPVDPFEAPTGRLPYPPEPSFSVDEAPTVPPETPSAKMKIQEASVHAPTTVDAPSSIDDLEIDVDTPLEMRGDDWENVEEERDPTLEDAFEILRAFAWDEIIPDPQAETLPPRGPSSPG
jgi:hypothetical protein